MQRALITGGAGFVGSHLADELLAHGYSVRVLDALIPQVHGAGCTRPSYLAADVELITADIRDRDAVRTALVGVDVVFHFAARVGVGQSMYEVSEYTSVNTAGTAVLLEALIEQPVRRLVVASSLSIYGEGLYRAPDEQVQLHVQRTADQLARGVWDPQTSDGRALMPVPTPESKPASPASVYAVTKYDQERMCLLVGAAYKMPTVALRLFNVYGPRQALSNPYTGVLAMFAARLLDNKPPLVFEDGRQRRDFVHVRDVATAARLALEVEDAAGQVFNIASGQAVSILEVAERMARLLGRDVAPEITGQHRAGDIRHCTADIGLARGVLGYRPRMELDAGLEQLAAWLVLQKAVDRVDDMREQRASRRVAR
jgi:dTDP-L-rhamnose 4-epimerase